MDSLFFCMYSRKLLSCASNLYMSFQEPQAFIERPADFGKQVRCVEVAFSIGSVDGFPGAGSQIGIAYLDGLHAPSG